MSTVFYRWGARKDESRVTFDGTHISVFDLKREIILNNKMGNGKDFDLGVFDNDTKEEFKDDNHQIPRSSSLVVKRMPAPAKGKGNAQNYIVGTSAADQLQNDHRIEAHAREAMLAKQKQQALRGSGGGFGSMSKRFDGKEEKKEEAVQISTGDADEDARIKAMFAQNEAQWEQMQEDMSMQSRAPAAIRARNKAAAAPKSKFDYSVPLDKEPPQGYICYRCGQKGHWIQDCPNNEDPQQQDKKRFVRVTGIPRSMLKTVETPGNEGSSAGAMLTADGGFVQAMPDKRQWQKVVGSKPRTMTVAEVRETQPHDAELACPICKKLIWDAVKTPCCSTSFCEDCITTYLLEHDFVCESCESKIGSLEELAVNEELRERVRVYMDAEIDRSKREKAEEDEQAGVTSGQGGEEGEGSGTQDPDQQVKNENDTAPSGETKVKTEGNSTTNSILDPAKMQEMMNPQTMQLYLSQIAKMMQNPKISPQGKALLQTQLQMVQTAVMQTQTQAMMGNAAGPSAQGNMGMNPMQMQMGMGMGMGMPMGMGMNDMMGMVMAMSGMPMGMHMGMGGGGMPMGVGGQGQGGFGGPGPMRGGGGGGGRGFRGGGPGGLRGRGGGGGARSGIPIPQVRPPKRNNDEMEFDGGGGGYGGFDKQQRVY